jgi:excisionase family DNA binding protein
MASTAHSREAAMSEGKLLYRPKEAAETLGVSRARLYQLLATGELGSVKIGASRRVPADDLLAFVARLRSESPAPAGVKPTAAHSPA